MATGYLARMHREGMRHEDMAPAPTAADFAAQVYDQLWESVTTKAGTRFSVLALDAEHAKAMGELKIEAMFGAGALAEVRLAENAVRDWFDAHALSTALQVETPQAWQARQDEYARRQHAGVTP